MLAPGMKPFSDLDLQLKTQLANGDHNIQSVQEEHHGKFLHRQLVQVLYGGSGTHLFYKIIIVIGN